jgi:hypothetical protein
VTILKNDKAKCRAALGKYLNNMLLLLSTWILYVQIWFIIPFL